MSLERLLFASTHGYLDPSSGAACATRDLLELLAARGIACRALTTGVLDFGREMPLAYVLAAAGVTPRPVGKGTAAFEFELGRVAATLLPTASSRAGPSPDAAESRAFLDLAVRVLEEFRPQVLLSYGGHPADLVLRAEARRRGVAVAFHLHNFAYHDRGPFADVDAVLVPSEYARRHYARAVGLACTYLPYPLRPERVVTADSAPRYLTFVNPEPNKGLAVFVRIAAELGRRRPDIPILVVEGRGTAEWLGHAGVDLAGVRTLHRMASTPDPRHFWRVSRAVIVPSLWRESFGRVAAEGMANGLPVLASDRGALPETLGDAGFLFHVPARYTPEANSAPTAREVRPWVATVERLWDDAAFWSAQRSRSLAEARRWEAGTLAGRYIEVLGGLARQAR